MPCRLSWPCSIRLTRRLDAERAVDDLVGRRLVHAAVAIAAREDAAHVAARRHQDRRPAVRRHHAQPRVVERGVAARRIEPAPLLLHAAAAEQRRAGRRSRAPRSGRPAARSARSAPAARSTSLVGVRRAVGDRDEVDVVDRLQRVERGGEVGRAPATTGLRRRRLAPDWSAAPPRSGIASATLFGGGGSISAAISSPPGSALTHVDEVARVRRVHRQAVVDDRHRPQRRPSGRSRARSPPAPRPRDRGRAARRDPARRVTR